MSKRNKILVITQWSFKDPLIQAYTLPYLFIISKILSETSRIYLVTFEQAHQRLSKNEKKEIRNNLEQKKIRIIFLKYSTFGVLGMAKSFLYFLYLMTVIINKRITNIHAWCMTGGTLGYMLAIVTHRKLIIDSYEPHAEAMVENKTWSEKQLKFKLLFFFEKKLSGYADAVISTTAGMKEYAALKYKIYLKRFYVKPACVDLKLFNLSKKKNSALIADLKLENKIVGVYAGKFDGIYLTKEIFFLLREAELIWGEKFRALLLTNYDNKILISWAEEAGFDPNKLILQYVPHNLIPDYTGLGDFAITPVKPVPTKRYCTPIKDGEYWALGLPVIITKNISDDSDIIQSNNIGSVLQSLEKQSYNSALLHIDDLMKEDKVKLSERIFAVAEKYRSYEIAENIYRSLYGDNMEEKGKKFN